ncbi:UNVERIFIED_ORG: DNA-3-methyladenine glycosylase I [Idiomarina abyssalis]|uniref:DNA-3-methyladenine glycosylase I n=1 Tax=Idiomarina sp. 017G TaxID=2183988 RepID=UPI000E0F9F59|nr:DNA-3-methyladenine glycosylase I [Idiomarina sp. 017G]TDO50909.1 DNA-3-methyladenine glycosylase I [Idiomarina sp. 017G]
MTNNQPERCSWCESADDYRAYHDNVWGRPVSDPIELFAKLCLDGQQAGLSWLTILRKQSGYEKAFLGFDPQAIVAMSDADRELLYSNRDIIRSKAKIDAIFTNAEAYLRMEEKGVKFEQWLWEFVGGSPIINAYPTQSEIPTETKASQSMAKALKKEGFKFVGPTICYAFMEAVGMVNDHVTSCHCYQPVADRMKQFTL